MTYSTTRHAADVIARRAIDSAWISLAITSPTRSEKDPIDPSLTHHLRRIPDFGNRVLRVIFDANVVPPRVITVYFDRTVKDLP